MKLQTAIIILAIALFAPALKSSDLFAQGAPGSPQGFVRSAPQTIVPVTTDSRIKTLVYNANEVYQLKFHYGYQSFIEFAEDEETEMISIGESFAWRLTPAGKRLFIRPLEIGAHTNMTIITNKRTYQFDIASAEYDGRADEELVYTVRFYYPEIGVSIPIPPQLSQPNIPQNARPQPSTALVKAPIPQQFVGQNLSPEIMRTEGELNFRYSIAGLSDNITPLKIYDDGKETFFQFKDKNLIVPAINTVDIFGNEQSTGYAIREGFVVVPGVSPQFTLRLADSLICVFNEAIVSRPASARANIYEKRTR
ncbi:MAG: TrbG/VirB9 family P-type conjugative transfer protein [Pseudomonadota bacterium]